MAIFSTIDPSKSISRPVAAAPQVTARVSAPVIAPHKSVVSEPANRPPTTRRMSGHGSYSTPSIMDALREEPTVEETSVVSETSPDQYSTNETVYPFSIQELLEAWKIFVEKIDAPQLKSALGAREPVILDDWQIEYELDTELQLNRLALDLKPKLQGYLRHHFRNEAIEIQFKVSENASQRSNIPYTDAERWALLVEKYPPLAGLKAKFGLDFEHF
ncbi:MAG: hypothetical protein GZ094_03020 [Mariniphaga sp.]|nr:hypothetical protein [Mariniphaga sp.]